MQPPKKARPRRNFSKLRAKRALTASELASK